MMTVNTGTNDRDKVHGVDIKHKEEHWFTNYSNTNKIEHWFPTFFNSRSPKLKRDNLCPPKLFYTVFH
jgi:hypothetical protein